MNWISLSSVKMIDELLLKSTTKVQFIFKHSYRCSISTMAKSRIERALENSAQEIFLVDVIEQRTVSNKIAELLNVQHESPQLLAIENSKCTSHASHSAITAELIQ